MLHVLPGVFQQSHCGPSLKHSSPFFSCFVDVDKAAAIPHAVVTKAIAGVPSFVVATVAAVAGALSCSNVSNANNFMVV